jgi:hypothetical protein
VPMVNDADGARICPLAWTRFQVWPVNGGRVSVGSSSRLFVMI